MTEKKNPVSMIDVARRAGVSTTTVSHVLNNTRYVSQGTRDKVNQAIRELNYVPNASARTLKTGKTGKIQFIISDVDNYFFVSLIESIENALSARGYQLLLANTHEDWQREKNHLAAVTRSSVDGLILSTAQMDWNELQKYLPGDIPVILIDRKPDDSTVDSVYISTYQAVYRAVIRLHQEGHSRIGMIGARAQLSTTVERTNAYLDAMKDLHLEANCVPSDSLRNSSPVCYEKLVSDGCTAVIISNERLTEDLVHYLYRQRKPAEDVTLVGFMSGKDPHTMLSRVIEQPTDEMGQYAASRILQLIDDSSLPPVDKRLEATYMEEE
ncbi:MAG: LacI family DNA-binding transcriptional regulator [Solobacterium sp.]|nr:LacI family DNA-binding transcriptional regulator [Solobacterium sp.]